ncbi:multicopper oxidase family protein [Rubrobacter taiwanensis]|uniref:Multicopper oxidase family protein n=1 Tax=Rubrobacter taiwanensis TaxID=185139 RepID=A0A4R1BHZ4_9ACTN|nr:multicopper oxidase family protein [Rubrobacter taiwanensis]TCJ16851.1 multicopper oxidase family protein [Rubrobacter taiwanensis]
MTGGARATGGCVGGRPTRREFLRLAGFGAGALVLSGCGLLSGGRGDLPALSRPAPTGRVLEYTLEAAPTNFEIAGRELSTWGYNGGVPGPEIRVKEGDTLRVRVRNRLPAGTTVHWHGLPVPNEVDGVPHVTQSPIPPGGEFVYEFAAPAIGSYIYHSHVGLQLDRGLYGPLVVEPAREELSYDREYILMLDDWLDGLPGTPEDALGELRGSGRGMMGGMMRARGIEYPNYLINGRAPEDPASLTVRRGERVRLRLMNPSAETVFRFAPAGHRMTVTHADGQAIGPVEADVLRIGMGERYDVLLDADNPGVWQLAAVPEGKRGQARAVLRYRESAEESAPPADVQPPELQGRLLSYADLRDARERSFPDGGLFSGPDRTFELTLSGGMGRYVWQIDGQRYPEAEPLPVREGEWVRVQMRNHSMMAHPMHLHGHFFQLRNGTGCGPFKDTALVEAHMGELAFDFVADNPGEWFFHCHNAYHMETGMARVISYAGGA